MPNLIRDLHIRFSDEELTDLERMAAIQKVPVRSVVRACVRHFLIEWRAGREVVAQLGAVVWDAREISGGRK